ncbi:glycosyl hydrolase family 8 [Peristeroidobacter soli]|jgi:endoglucanase|uniref:glycosyl hydrolase family 8 n=1 Tax=Peristeroidobacter soli TaxID=2497877 RepID=UPI00101D09C1|nr:glycosyl hydrolase family 8 [Peristeroidobacter soli]
MLSTSLLLPDSALGAGVKCDAWPAWQRFKLLYLSHDGRIIDASSEAQITTSEGQSSALFFALVGNDREAFDRILRWTHNNLSGSQLERLLPARRWGRDHDGAWRVLDSHSATDANLWIAYTLGEASRLWNEQRYASLGADIAENILRQEGGRLNPRDLPLVVIRGLQRQTKDPLWTEIERFAEQVILGSTLDGFEYDTIRIYLWAGMLPASDPTRDKLLDALKPALEDVAKRAAPLETVGPPGGSAALLPMLANARMTATLQLHRQRAADGSLQDNQSHYSDALALFGLGWLEQRYRFNRSGVLTVRWTPASDRTH